MTVSERIADVIDAERESILRRWRDEARNAPPAAQRALTDIDLEDHLPQLLRELARTMRGEPTPQVEHDGAQHGRQRRELGYEVDECLCEMHLFRTVLLDVVEARRDLIAGSPGDDLVAARRRLFELLDRSVQASVRQYTRDAEDERDDAYARLTEANDELHSGHREKDRFFAVLAHELRNQLTPIATSVNLLRVPDLTSDRRDRALGIIERQMRQQKRLIDDLLDVNRIAHGKVELERTLVDLREAARHASESCLQAIETKAQRLQMTLPAEPVLVLADVGRMTQVLTNLVGNASKFTPDGGAIFVDLAQDGEHAVLRVRDDGAGIDRDMQARIFELYAQAESSVRHKEGGLGIGLWLARTLVELHAGTLHVESEGVGRGTSFVVRLPIADEQAQQAHFAHGRPLIAVVEDNEDARTSMVDVLSIWGYDVVEAVDGEEALAVARSREPTVFLLDIGLPRVDGYEVARRLRAMNGSRRPLLIALSGYASGDDRRRSLEAGFDHHLSKPVDVDRLREILERSVRSERRT
ncbi:MAG TPA: ATP-binding protein [Candidatus Binatia bacterium]